MDDEDEDEWAILEELDPSARLLNTFQPLLPLVKPSRLPSRRLFQEGPDAVTGGEGDTLLNKENVALSNNAGRGSFLSPLPPSAKHGLPLSDFPDSVSAKKPRLFGSATDLTSEPSALDHLLGCLSSEYSIPSSAMRHPSARLLMNPLLGDSSKRHSDSPLTSRSRFVNGQLMGLEGEEDEDEDFGGSMDLFSKALAEFKVNTAHKNTHDYSRLPATCNSFLQGKTSRGGALYFPKRSSSVLLSNKDESVPTKSISKKGLLKKSIFVMLSEVEKKVDATASVSRTPASSIALPKTSAETPSTIKGSLWVDKYRPKMYIDLVGDEKTNRAVLAWVKHWDYCSFDKDVKRKDTNKEYYSNGSNSNRFQENNAEVKKEDMDPMQRPHQRILLLAGPAGLGKTTMAHVIAQHAGYNVIEINASDDRTGESLKNKLVGAIETRVSMVNSKPNLVVIDEIDGASMSGTGDQNFIKMLMDKVQAGVATGYTDAKKSKKGKPKKGLLRPIICICNDPYAPVLRPLRSIAQILTIRPPASRDLAKRLQHICAREGLKTDLRTIMLLIDLVEGDIRSALNTLQFLSAKTAVLTAEIVREACVGQKDMQRGLYPIWKAIFELPGMKQKKTLGFQNGHEDNLQRDANDDRMLPHIVKMIQTNGEYVKLMQGLHENFLSCKITDMGGRDPSVRTKIQQAGDWLDFFDQLDIAVNARQRNEFMAYMAYPAAKFHMLFATGLLKFRIEYPRLGYQNFLDSKSNENITDLFLSGFSAQVQRTWTKRTVPVELIPFFSIIIAPTVKTINVQLAKPDERKKIENVVQALVSFGLKMIQQKNEDGIYSYRLEPPIETLTVPFQVKSKVRRSIETLPYPTQQFISQSVNLECMRLTEVSKKMEPLKKVVAVKQTPSKAPPKTPSKFFSPVPTLQSLTPTITEKVLAKAKKIDAKPIKDFFGRTVRPAKPKKVSTDQSGTETVESEEKKAPQVAKHSVLYRFNEGFSNAVRKPVLMKDLL